MADSALQPNAIPSQRLRALIFPREHGAWGMLLIPLLTGACVGLLAGGRVSPLILLTVLALTLFWLRTPVESLLQTSPMRAQTTAERRVVGQLVLWLTSLALLSLTGLLWNTNATDLLLLGAIAATAFGAQAVLKKRGRNLRMSAQVVGVLGLTSSAPAAYYVMTGHLDLRALALWFANWLFAGDQIHFVQLRIHAARAAGLKEKFARGRIFLAGQLVMALVLLLAVHYHLLPVLALLAFLPVFWRGSAWFLRHPESLAVHRLGWTELAHAVVFGVLLIAAFHLTR